MLQNSLNLTHRSTLVKQITNMRNEPTRLCSATNKKQKQPPSVQACVCTGMYTLFPALRMNPRIEPHLCLHNLNKIYIQQNTTKMHKMLYALLLTNTQHYFIFCSHADVLFVSKKMEVMSFIHTNLKAVVWGSHMIKFHCFTNLFLMWQITKSKLNYWISCLAYLITNKHCT